MNTMTMRTMMAAAALVIAAGSASAQTYKAEVPVAFQVGSKTMAPGSYDVRVTSGADKMVVIRNRTTNRAAALVTGFSMDAPKAWVASGNPMIAFECTGGACSLRKLWTGSGNSAYVFPAAKAPAGELVAQRSEVVALTMIRAR